MGKKVEILRAQERKTILSNGLFQYLFSHEYEPAIAPDYNGADFPVFMTGIFRELLSDRRRGDTGSVGGRILYQNASGEVRPTRIFRCHPNEVRKNMHDQLYSTLKFDYNPGLEIIERYAAGLPPVEFYYDLITGVEPMARLSRGLMVLCPKNQYLMVATKDTPCLPPEKSQELINLYEKRLAGQLDEGKNPLAVKTMAEHMSWIFTCEQKINMYVSKYSTSFERVGGVDVL